MGKWGNVSLVARPDGRCPIDKREGYSAIRSTGGETIPHFPIFPLASRGVLPDAGLPAGGARALGMPSDEEF